MGIHTFMFLLLNSLLYFSNGDQPVEEEPTIPLIVKETVRPPLGSPYPLNPEGSQALRMATKAIEIFNEKSSPEENFTLEKITSVVVQVTNAIDYHIEAVIGKTECLKSDEKSDEEPDTESCVLGKKEERTCTFKLSFRPDDEYELRYSSCKE